jgi:hypothetical protein
MAPSGNSLALKSFQSFAVSEDLLAKVTEAVRAGEKEARSSGDTQSVEVFYRGFRQNISIGRIFIVPAKVADNLDTFPTSLLYGVLMREFGGEEMSDMIEHKIGETEFDEYSKGDLQTIKDKLFKSVDGKYESIVLFAPNWMNKREYQYFKYTDDITKLTNLLRHIVFAAYFDPRLSSAFEALMTVVDTTKLDVTDITPKMNFPFLAENPLKQFPELLKQAATAKKKIFLTAKTADAVTQEVLEPQEMDVFDSLDQALRQSLLPNSVTPGEVGEKGFKPPTSESVPRAAAAKEPFGGKQAPPFGSEKKEEKGESKEAASIETRIGMAGGADVLQTIIDKLNAIHADMKKKNPRGYMDAFEQRLDLNMAEIAQSMGLEMEYKPDTDTYVFYDQVGKAYKDQPVNYDNEGTLTVGADAPVTQSRLKTHQSSAKVAYVSHVPGHTNSKGESAPWVIKQHNTDKILESFHSKGEAEEGLKNMESHKHGSTPDSVVPAAHETPVTNVGPGTGAAEAQEGMVKAVEEKVEVRKGEAPIGIAIDETGVARRGEEERKVAKRTKGMLPTMDIRPGTNAKGNLSKLEMDRFRNGGYVEREHPDGIKAFCATLGSDKQADQALEDHAREVAAGGYGEQPLSKSATDKLRAVKLAIQFFRKDAGEIDADKWGTTPTLKSAAAHQASYIADIIGTEIDDPYVGMSPKAKKAAQEKEAKLATLRKEADVAVDLDEIWDSITEDIGPAPLIPVGNDGGQNSSTDGEAHVSEEMKSDEPEDTKSMSDSEAESQEDSTPEAKEDSGPKSEWAKNRGKSKSEESKKAEYQPKTGQPCTCKPGVQRDNCPQCEGTGQRIDFAAIRNRNKSGSDDMAGIGMGLGKLADLGLDPEGYEVDIQQVKEQLLDSGDAVECGRCGAVCAYSWDNVNYCENCSEPIGLDLPKDERIYHVSSSSGLGEWQCGNCGTYWVDRESPIAPREEEFDIDASTKQADTADNPANEKGGEGAIVNKTDADIKNTHGTTVKYDVTGSSKKADTADNPANEAGGSGAIEVKNRTDVKDTSGPEIKNTASKVAMEIPDRVLYDLLKWVTGGNRTGNPYTKPEIEAALRAIAKARGFKDVDKNWYDALDNWMPEAGAPEQEKQADTADNPANEKGGEGAIENKAKADISDTQGETPKFDVTGSMKTAWMNQYDIEEAVQRFANDPVLGKAARFMKDFMDEVNSHSDGWAYWQPPSRAAKQMMELLRRGEENQRNRYTNAPQAEITEKDFLRALAPIRAFYTRRGNAAGMQFPKVAADISGDMAEAKSELDYNKSEMADEPEAEKTVNPEHFARFAGIRFEAGRGATPQEKARYTYNSLKKIQRELTAAGVNAEYVRGGMLKGSDGANTWDMGYHWGNMSNGESVGTALCVINFNGKKERYSGWGYNADGSFEQGVAKVKEMFGQKPSGPAEVTPQPAVVPDYSGKSSSKKTADTVVDTGHGMSTHPEPEGQEQNQSGGGGISPAAIGEMAEAVPELLAVASDEKQAAAGDDVSEETPIDLGAGYLGDLVTEEPLPDVGSQKP